MTRLLLTQALHASEDARLYAELNGQKISEEAECARQKVTEVEEVFRNFSAEMEKKVIVMKHISLEYSRLTFVITGPGNAAVVG
jgi:hypothetical protein